MKAMADMKGMRHFLADAANAYLLTGDGKDDEGINKLADADGRVALGYQQAKCYGKLNLSYGGNGKLNLRYAQAFEKGMRVTCDIGYDYLIGEVVHVNMDGSCDVVFPDGNRENYVQAEAMKIVNLFEYRQV
jgi:hypothetical protein